MDQTQQKSSDAEQDDVPGAIELPSALTIQELAALMDVDPIDIIKQFMRAGFMFTVNEVVERDMAEKIVQAFGLVVAEAMPTEQGASIAYAPDGDDEEGIEPRPPVITILGHVDHGKTTLLDQIRKSNVVSREAGGITQHMGAYQVNTDGHILTFLDTPGHAAFTAMRSRGAQVTDIAVLVVAADDGIMPQTLEAIDHIRAADVPMVIAVNKIDRAEADPEKVKRQLSEQNLLVEDWGGDIISVPMSALTGEGVSDLLENLYLVSELEELKANPNKPAWGVTVEAQIDKSKGPLATLLVQTGTLRLGDNVVVGAVHGRIKAMLDDSGKRISEAGPSVPVEILGLNGLPMAGELFNVVENERAARAMSQESEIGRQSATIAGVTLGEIYSRIEAGQIKALNLVVKTDVQGTTEAVRMGLESLNSERTRINLLRVAAGSITESDVLLAEASDAIIIGFNTGTEPGANSVGKQKGVEIRSYDVIYALLDDVGKALEGLLEPEERDILEGYATVRAVFKVGGKMRAAGIYVNDGRILRDATIRIGRDKKTIFEGPIVSLKHFKDDVREIATGFEGGIVVEGFQDYAEGDVLEAHRIEIG
jgi:translation initiation factor IF-2